MVPVRLLVSAIALSALAAGCAGEAPAQSATQHLSTAQCDVFARDGRITICHATGSARNPVVVMRVAEAACVNAHSDHPGDYVAINGDCGPSACLPQLAPCDATLRCCDGLTCDAGTCVNIDACAAPANACGANATCTDLPAPAPGDASGRTCACNAGYEGDGITCRDINACANPANACDPNATCADLAAPAPGDASGRTCACNPGYAGNGETCADVDECAAGTDNCSDNATCSNTPGSFSCACNPGYSGNGVACTDIDECAAGTDSCSDNATCSNTPGSFSCTCNSGYGGDGATCTDVNECATNNGGCSSNASCINNAGGPPTCTCNLGFTGNGLTCTASGSSCATASGFCYTDTPADDVAGAALRNYFTSLGTVSPSDFIYFDITTRGVGATGGAWCSERADWYVSNYLTHTAPGTSGSGAASPGGHRRYSRIEGQPWSGPVTNSYYNYYGSYCDGSPFSWCSEWGIGGFYLGTMPSQTQYYGESYVGNGTYWSYGAGWSVTVRVGSTRLEACGF